tara:strand:- start:3878 stop:4207 length:330 start_codon:yes stop_codon:yes gene_type:complete
MGINTDAIIKLKMIFSIKYKAPPLTGSIDLTITAENVVIPAQNPGSKRWPNSELAPRSIRTKKKEARATPIKLAARVPERSSGIARDNQYRARVPATPPRETSSRFFMY